jgi:hypothetical protein
VRVKPSNKVIINCVCIFVLLLLAGLYTYSFTNFTMTRVGEAPRDAELPFLRVSEKPDGVYTLKGQMTVRPLSPHEYFIVVDDRLLKFSINDQVVDVSKIPPENLYDWKYGFSIDLEPYLTKKVNDIEFVFRDYTGLYGVRMLSDFSELRLIPFRILWVVCLGVLIWNALIFFKVRTSLAVVVLAGIFLRIAYTLITDFNVRGHDTDEHIEYIMFFVNNWLLPHVELAKGGAFFHPPLYYFVASLFYRVADFFYPDQNRYAYGMLQYLSVVFSAGFLVYSALLIQKFFAYFFDKKDQNDPPAGYIKLASILSLALVTFWPSVVMHSPRIGNDPLLYFLFVAGLYYIFSFYISPSAKCFLKGAIFTALAVAAKANGAILVALGGIVLLTVWFVHKKPDIVPLIKKGIAPVLIIFGALVLTFYPGIALKLSGDRTHLYIDNITNIPATLQTGNKAGNYLWMDLKTFITKPYTSPYTDEFGRQYFANYLSKTGLIGEWWFEGDLAENSVGIISFSYLLLLVFFVVGLYHYSRRDYLNVSPLLWAYVLLLASIYYMRMTFPANIDFRYITPALLPFSILYNFGTIRLWAAGHGRLALTATAIQIVFIIGSLLFFSHFIAHPRS